MAQGKVVYVKSGGTGTTGTSWTDALGNVASALAKAESGDQIFVAAGVYTQSWGTIKPGVSLFGGFKGTETGIAEREKSADNAYEFTNETVITVAGTSVFNATASFAGDNSLSIDGFTFKECSHNAIIMTVRGGMTMQSCRFVNNTVIPPGTPPGTNDFILLNITQINAETETRAVVSDCLFEGNINQQNASILGMSSAASNCYGVVERTIFRGNSTNLPNGSTNANVLNCKGTGGINTVWSCLFYNNSTKQAVINSGENTEIINSLIYNNSCGTNNVLLAGRMYNSLVVNNTSRFCFNSNSAKLYNSIVVGNALASLALNGIGITTPEAKNSAVEKSLPDRGIYADIALLTVDETHFVLPSSFLGTATSDLQKTELANCDWSLLATSPLINGGLSSWFKESRYGSTNKDCTDTHVRYYGAWTDMGAYEIDKKKLTLVMGEGGTASADQSGHYAANQSIQLSVVPNAGFRIKEWKDEAGQVVSTAASFTYTMPNADKTLTASFEATTLQYALTVVAGQGGTVTDVSGNYFADQVIELVATPAIGYRFKDWTDQSGNVLSTESSFSYSMPSSVVTVTANFQLKQDDGEKSRQFDFEGLSVNKQWKAIDGTIAVSADRSQTGTQSLCWTTAAKQANVLKIDLAEGYGTEKVKTCYFNFYNQKALRNGTLGLKFIDSEGTVVRTATLSLDFVGWREFERRYGYDFARKSAIDDVQSIEFTLNNPTGEATSISLDQVNFVGTVSNTRYLSDWNAPDASLFISEQLLADYAPILDPTMPYLTPTADELSGLATLKSRYSTAPREGDIASARTFVKSLNLTRNSDGTIKGAPVSLRDFALLNGSQIIAIAVRLETLGYAAQTSEEDKQLLNDYLDYIIDQGTLYKTTVLSSSDYAAVRAMGQALTQVLGACQTERQSLEWAHIVSWIMSYGHIYQTDYATKQNSDILYNYIEYYMATASNIKEPTVAVREVKGMMRYLDRASEITPGGSDLLKPDGTGFHHSTHYPNYMYAYRGWIGVWYNVRGTVFRATSEAYESFKKAAMSMCLLATRGENNFIGNSMGGRNPFEGNKLQLFKSNMTNLAELGGDVYGKASDEELDAFNAYLFEQSSTSTQYDGYYSFNWSPAGVYRHNNWVATMRAPTTKFWGSEIYSSRNRFGRYQSHGTLEVLYNNEVKASGYPANRNESGWDWNVVPGGTTVHYTNWTEMMPAKNAAQRFDQFAKTKTFSGSLSFDAGGVFASDFDQIDTWSTQCFAPTGLSFKKSVFAFDGKLISLGSNVTSTATPANTSITATNLFQSFKPTVGPNVQGTVIPPTESVIDYSDATWMITPEGTGYYVPKGNDKVSLFYGTQKSPKDDGSNVSSPGSAVAAKAYINHGVTPTDKNYHFVVVPGTNTAAMTTLANQVGENGGTLYSINCQDATLHSLTYQPLKTTAYAFFGAKSGLTFGRVLAADSELLLMEKIVSDSRLSYGVCNPNLRPKEVTGGWEATPTHTSITLKGKYALVAPNENLVVTIVDDNTVIAMTLTDGLPLYFELDDLIVGIHDSVAMNNYQMWTEKDRLQVVGNHETELSVYNITGVKIAYSKRALNHSLSLPQGVYVVRLNSEKEHATTKVVIP